MPENNRSIGGQGLEQGGPNLGNDITRDDLSPRNAGDALTSPTSMGVGHHDDEEDVEKDEDPDLLSDYSEVDEDEEEDDEEDKNI